MTLLMLMSVLNGHNNLFGFGFKTMTLLFYSKEKYMATYLYRKACANFKYYIFLLKTSNYALNVRN